MLPTPIKNSRQKERTEAIIEYLNKRDVDVILLQEAFSKRFQKHVRRDLSKNYPYFYRLGTSKKLIRILNSGLVVLSKKPIKVVDHRFFDHATGPDKFASKGVLLLDYPLPNNDQVQIAVTHLQSGHSDKKVAVRRTQLEVIKEVLETNKLLDVTQIIMGDLNVNSLKEGELESSLNLLGMNFIPSVDKFSSSRAEITGCFKKVGEVVPTRHDQAWIRNSAKYNFDLSLRVLTVEGSIKGEMCELSDHRPIQRAITYDERPSLEP